MLSGGKHESGRARWRKIIIIVIIVIAVAAIVAVVVGQQGKGSSSQSSGGNYVDSDKNTTASLEMTVKYQPDCTGLKDCEPTKQNNDFKIFVFDKTGQQVRVIRADDKGVFRASMPQGDYILIVGKAIKGEGMPQEQVSLKNGKILKLDVSYGSEVR